MRALALNCTLKSSPEPSSADLMARQFLEALAAHGVDGEVLRVVDHEVPPGVAVDLGGSDGWPSIRERILDARILVVVSPIWLGHPSSVAQRVLERLNADSSETDEDGRPLHAGRIALVGVVGNEDGAHKVTADLYQGLDDVGFTIPAQGGTYWTGEAMHTVDYRDLDQTPEATAAALRTAAAHGAHLARLLAERPYPAP